MLKRVKLGKSGIEVSRICFGSLTVSALGANLPVNRGAQVIAYALENGINFIDTAQYYQNYEVIREGIALYRERSGAAAEEPVICSKTYAWNRELAQAAVDEARSALNRDVIDIFMLHEQESMDTLRGHAEALEYLYECRDRGIIRAVGISTHCVDAVNVACEISHSHGQGLDVVFPMYNKSGLGIHLPRSVSSEVLTEEERKLAARTEMYNAIKRCHDSGVGVMLMKVFGGGHLLGEAIPENVSDGNFNRPSSRAAEALKFAIDCDAADSVALGMQSEDEVAENIRFFESGSFSDGFCEITDRRQRKLIVEDYCEGCGRCVRRCGSGAMSIKDGVAFCDTEKCVLCGYCAGVCPHFAIKVV